MRNNILDYVIHLIHWGRDEIDDNFADDIFKYIFLEKILNFDSNFTEVCS